MAGIRSFNPSYHEILKCPIQYNAPTMPTLRLLHGPENLNSKAIHDKQCDQSKSTPSVPLSSAPMIAALLLLAPELGVDEMVRGGTTVGGELATGSDGGGKNDDVALQITTNVGLIFWTDDKSIGIAPSICNDEGDRMDVESRGQIPWQKCDAKSSHLRFRHTHGDDEANRSVDLCSY